MVYRLSGLSTIWVRLKDPNKKHIDLCKVFEKGIVKDNFFDGKYRTASIDSVSRALLGIGKYGKLNAGTSTSLSNRILVLISATET
jgi:hypothetical protein